MVKRQKLNSGKPAKIADIEEDVHVEEHASDSDEEGGRPARGSAPTSSSGFRNKEKTLVLCTRGATYRYRHLMMDLCQLLPHSKKESKLDTKSDRGVINEVADLKGCTSTIFFEVRKRQDLYLWMSKCPSGPSVKFHVQNVHTMEELKLSGNHLKASRPVLSFQKAFDEQPHLQLLKELFTQLFATPKDHRKSKPFFDHVLSFSVADGRIWLRNYQVVVPADNKKSLEESTSLVEVGPRACLNPVRIFAGSFGGATLYENPAYVSPNVVRAMLKRKAGAKYNKKVDSKVRRKKHVEENTLEVDELAYNNAFR